MMIELNLKVAGTLLIVLGLAHCFFPKRFGWKEDLATLSLLNRQIFLVHCFFIALTLVLMGSITVLYAKALLEPSPITRAILAGAAIFWACRLLVQFFVYDSKLWRGNVFNTWMHALFSCLWTYLTATYTIAATFAWR
jgi:hypothetical protein